MASASLQTRTRFVPVRGPIDIDRAVRLLFGLSLTVITATQLTAGKFARGDESAQRRLAKFYLYDDASLYQNALNHLLVRRKPDLTTVIQFTWSCCGETPPCPIGGAMSAKP